MKQRRRKKGSQTTIRMRSTESHPYNSLPELPMSPAQRERLEQQSEHPIAREMRLRERTRRGRS